MRIKTIYNIVSSPHSCLEQMSWQSCTEVTECGSSFPACVPNECKLCCLRMSGR